MLYIRQPFFSIATASIFAALGLVYGIGAQLNFPVVFLNTNIDPTVGYALSGLLFVMAYFSLVHLKQR